MNTLTGTNLGKNVHALPFALGQRVRIDAIDVTGVVKSIQINVAAIEYQVAYFDDDKVRRVEWFEAFEISA